MTVTLYSIAVSHPGHAVRGMLARKRIDHRVVDLWPGMQPLVRIVDFPRHTVPALLLGDGRKVQGSIAIARALEQLRPEPPLFPADPADRARVEAAERWGDEVLQPVPRRIFRWMTVRHEHVRVWIAGAAHVPFGRLLRGPPSRPRGSRTTWARTTPRCRPTSRRSPGTSPRSSGSARTA